MQKNEISIYGKNNNYLSEYQGILDDFKEIHRLMAEATGPEVFYLVTGAQKKLTRKSVEEIDKMIKDLVMDFTDINIEKFMEKIISILSSLETTKQLYGNIIDVESIRKYISKKLTILTLKRYNIVDKQILKNRFIEESKLKVLYTNITNCKKIIMFAIDLDGNNIKAIEFIISMLNNLITKSAQMGVDNYTREVILLEVKHYEEKLDLILSNVDEENNISKYNANLVADKSNVVNEKAVEESCNMLVTLNQSSESKINQTKRLTEQFISTSNEVIVNAKRNSGGGSYINEAVRQFASIMSTVQTINYLQNGSVDINSVAKNISTHLLNLSWESYLDLINIWNGIDFKTSDDIKMFNRETNQYCDILLKSYEIYPDNIIPLKRFIEIIDQKLKQKLNLKLTKDDELNLDRLRKNKAEIVKRKDPNYKLVDLDSKKKKGIFSRLWGH